MSLQASEPKGAPVSGTGPRAAPDEGGPSTGRPRTPAVGVPPAMGVPPVRAKPRTGEGSSVGEPGGEPSRKEGEALP